MGTFVCRRRMLVVLWITAAIGSALPDTARAGPRSEAEARALETRLRAPCCPTQLLDGHESEPARALRREIRARLNAGETTAALEADLVSRYGTSIVAVPRDRDPREPLSLALLAGLVLTAAWLVFRAARWVRRPKSGSEQGSSEPDAVDAKIDAELRRFDAK